MMTFSKFKLVLIASILISPIYCYAQTDANTKPKLENYSSYNDFLHAMYLYNKLQEDLMKPKTIINIPITHITSTPEYTQLDANSDVNSWGETINTPQSTHVTNNQNDTSK